MRLKAKSEVGNNIKRKVIDRARRKWTLSAKTQRVGAAKGDDDYESCERNQWL